MLNDFAKLIVDLLISAVQGRQKRKVLQLSGSFPERVQNSAKKYAEELKRQASPLEFSNDNLE
jgi:hypothetical protein